MLMVLWAGATVEVCHFKGVKWGELINLGGQINQRDFKLSKV